MNALSVANLGHSFGNRRVLDSVSFSVAEGRMCVLLGRNGAGKTTLFSLITGLYHARAGSVRVFDHAMDANPAAALARMGVVFQLQTLDLDLTAGENLRYHAALHGLTKLVSHERSVEELGRLEVLDRIDDPARVLSGGQRRRVEIARALMHKPRLLLLDEPTTGLDVPGRRALERHVRALCRERGIAVLWATHFLEEVAADDDVVVLHQGTVRWAGRGDRFAADFGVAGIAEAFDLLTGSP
ncbi:MULTISPECIES: ATP-binding cassette domain-containing protein [unclassified Mesorhizobium]|uniref:ATP-binding cassette domain-containing protein n=1 Tax=unclassified Mesorhizobium TaxID=325217 RepID=UPI000BAFE7E1|nr:MULTISPECIES: ATP-binding cassette domain-containing protein [unclassified Mesorhizobium]PBB84899.1 ABC transporter ATP-binding protein [Mesorhizobium sp. WSM3876]RWE27223.1 MAG: ATP-binding cassette domain-containing protein [Mesorhizobium sp.]TGT54360.1 ATP-binding cassette domain-containing protein [Mesorhizobium sp. M00.F.Ca.ET.170.01.1.1]